MRCFRRLGGVPEAMVVDNDSSIVAEGVWRPCAGTSGLRLTVLDPGKPEAKGQVERTNSYLETSFLPLRSFADPEDLQAQSDAWADDVAYRRHHRRVGARVGDALATERRCPRALPDPHSDVDLRTEARVQTDGFVRVRDVGYSVPPWAEIFGDPVEVAAMSIAWSTTPRNRPEGRELPAEGRGKEVTGPLRGVAGVKNSAGANRQGFDRR